MQRIKSIFGYRERRIAPVALPPQARLAFEGTYSENQEDRQQTPATASPSDISSIRTAESTIETELRRKPSLSLGVPFTAFDSSSSSSAGIHKQPSPSTSTSSRHVSFSETTEEIKVSPSKIEVELKKSIRELEPWKQKIISILLQHMFHEFTTPFFRKFVLWYMDKHLHLNEDKFNILFKMIKSQDSCELDISFSEKTSTHTTDGYCIKTVLRMLIENSASLCEADLSRMDLSDVKFSKKVDLTSAKFVGTNLTGIDLTDTILNEADLTGANLTDADLSGVQLKYATLDSTILTGAILDGACLHATKLSNRKPSGPNFNSASLKGADLTYANLMGAQFDRTDFRNCRCVLTKFNYADFKDVTFESTELKGATFVAATLDSVYFMHTDTSRANFDDAKLIKTNLT